MLSYRHAFHAGNHADVLKHNIQIELLRYLALKDKPFWYIDTHAGAGIYELDSKYATKLKEYSSGVGKLWQQKALPPLVNHYVQLIRDYNPDGALRHYPGSPEIASHLLRECDRMRLFELHITDTQILARHFHKLGNRCLINHQDGLAGLKAFLPPPPRRALVLIDPSYENKSDYQAVVATLKDALARFPTGTYALWYPQIARIESRELPARLKKLPSKSWLHVSLSVKRPEMTGMHGSGMFILNPPWTLEAALREALPWLTQALAEDDSANFTLETSPKS